MPTMLSLLLGKRKINFKDLIAKEVAELAWVPNLAKLSANFSSMEISKFCGNLQRNV